MSQDVVVVDTSVIIKWLNRENEEHVEKAKKLIVEALDDKVILIAPELAKYEVGNVLLTGKHLSAKQAVLVFDQFYKLPVTYVEDTLITARNTFELASEAKITYYDASFIALARQYDATLVTDNIKHQGKLNKLKVIALADY